MRRATVAALGALAGVIAILGRARSAQRPHGRPRTPTPIPPTLPPVAEEGKVPKSTHPRPDRADAPVGVSLVGLSRRQDLLVAVLVALVCFAGLALFLVLLPESN